MWTIFAISANTEIIGQYTLTAEENLEKTIENLRVYDDDDNKIVYRAEEVDINSIFYRWRGSIRFINKKDKKKLV